MNRLKSTFEELSCLGVDLEMPLYERRQIRLLNQLSVMILVLAVVDLLVNLAQQRFTLIIGDLVLIPIMGLLPFLSARGRTTLARFLFSITLQSTVLLSILLEWESITMGVYLQHLLYLVVAALIPVVFVNRWNEPVEYWLMFSLHTLLIVFVVGLPYVNAYFRPVQIPAGDFDLIIMATGFVWLILMFLGWFFTQGYWIYNEKMEDYRQAADASQRQIDELSELAAQLRRELRKYKTQVNKRVQERTRVLESDNQRLREYALINAHLVRAPLARIKGLSQLLQMEGPTPTDREVMDRLRESTQELENMIRRIQSVVDEQPDAFP